MNWFEVQQVTGTIRNYRSALHAAGYANHVSAPAAGMWSIIASVKPPLKAHMDIMFSPRGVVAGPLAASGKIHLMLAEIEDTLQKRPPELAEGENIITSIYTNTGNVAAAPVDKVNAHGTTTLRKLERWPDDE